MPPLLLDLPRQSDKFGDLNDSEKRALGTTEALSEDALSVLRVLTTARNITGNCPAPFMKKLLSGSGCILASSNMAALTNETVALGFLGSCA